MDETMVGQPTATEARELQDQIDAMLREFDSIHRQMRDDRLAIERSSARTRAILASLSTVLRPSE